MKYLKLNTIVEITVIKCRGYYHGNHQQWTVLGVQNAEGPSVYVFLNKDEYGFYVIN